MDKIILKNKVKLINWLQEDSMNILQHVQSREFVTKSEYDKLKSIEVHREKVTDLLDIICGKGEKVCRDFLNMLKEDDVNEFSPQLRDWIKTLNTSANQTEEERDNRKQNHIKESSNRTISDYQEFLKKNTSFLVQKVKNIDPIIDDLPLHSESVANVRAQTTPQDKMRKLLDFINSQTIAKLLVDALFTHEDHLMNERFT